MTFSSALTSTPVVLLPGMMCDDRLFTFQTEQLRKDSQNAVKLYIPQLINGNSMPELAQYLLTALPPSFCLCGLSMGGILAMEIVAQAPHRVERLALMDTNPLAETEEGVARRNRQMREVRAGKLRQVIAEEMKPHYLADSPNKKSHLNLCMDMAVSLGDNSFINQSMALRDRPDQTDTLKAVRCPTLLLHGSEDRLCPPERHHLMQELIPHARLVEINGAGHLPPLEAPMTTYKHFSNWLRY